MGFRGVPRTDIDFPQYEARIREVVTELQKKCDEKARKGELCSSEVQGSSYTLVYPALRVSVLRNSPPPQADSHQRYQYQVGQTEIVSQQNAGGERRVIGFYDFSNGNRTCTKGSCFFLFTERLRERALIPDDQVAIPDLLQPSNRELAMLIGDFNNDGHLDVAFFSSRSGINLFLTTSEEGPNDNRELAIVETE